MKQSTRILIIVAVLVVLIGAVLGIEELRRRNAPVDVPAGNVPIYINGTLTASFAPADLEQLDEISFVDAEEGKLQEGWALRDVLQLHVPSRKLKDDTQILIISSSRDKQADLTWAQVADPDNWVMFDLSGRGTLKLVSVLEELDVRDEWVQDVDRIEVNTP